MILQTLKVPRKLNLLINISCEIYRMEYPIRVIDPDEEAHAEFRVELKGDGAERFRVDPKSGKIFVGNTALDREEQPQYNLKLVAIDRGNLTNTAQLNIFVLDTNDNP